MAEQRLIDANELDDWLEEAELEAQEKKKYVYAGCINTIRGNIRNFPTIERRRIGTWIGVNPMVDTLECSVCGYNILGEEFKTRYCPDCGAKMEGDYE